MAVTVELGEEMGQSKADLFATTIAASTTMVTVEFSDWDERNQKNQLDVRAKLDHGQDLQGTLTA